MLHTVRESAPGLNPFENQVYFHMELSHATARPEDLVLIPLRIRSISTTDMGAHSEG